ncbi:MAG: N-acetylmuramoyl-L-alanine amidase, partial [Clostridia bacterium]|nr:N-acetylmuramoyl-L-alanine amidase [Clostridia bacterium]
SYRRGIQVFYDDTGYGKGFALNMQSTINTYLNSKYCGREFAALGGDYYITKCARVPSIIIECGFISNAEDMKLLSSDSYIKELCNHIADSVEACASDEVSSDIG